MINAMKLNSLTIAIVTILSVVSWQCTKSTSTSQPAAAVDTTSTHDSAAVQPVPVPVVVQLSYEQEQGKRLYSKYCSICHGNDGKGDGFNAYNLDPKPQDFTNKKYLNSLTDNQISRTISGGGRTVNKSPLMPSWGGRLNKRQIEYLVSYVRTFSQ